VFPFHIDLKKGKQAVELYALVKGSKFFPVIEHQILRSPYLRDESGITLMRSLMRIIRPRAGTITELQFLQFQML